MILGAIRPLPHTRLQQLDTLIDVLTDGVLKNDQNKTNVMGSRLNRAVRKTQHSAISAFNSIQVKFDCYATLYKSLSVWAEALKA